MSKWASNISSINKNQGDNGLRLCDWDRGSGVARCTNYDVCDGAATIDRCYPYEVWSSTPTGSDYYYFRLLNGSFLRSSQDPRYADSVAVSWRAELRPLTLSPAAEAAALLSLKTTKFPMI